VTTAQAYEATALPDVGAISGTITLLGVLPPARLIKGPVNARESVAEVPDEGLIVGANRGIENVVAWAMDIIAPARGAFGAGGSHRS
jgi:hypothetical protein